MDSSTSSSSYKTLNTLISNAEHLEHFHQYEQTKQQQQKIQDSHPPQWSPALRMHTDSGLLIGMTSGYHSSVETGMNENNNGLYIELPQGGVYQVSCPDDALIFMVGQGGASWFNSESGLNLRAVPHALILPWEKKNNNDNGIQKLWRSWYGRMFLPPADALVSSSQEGVLIPFQELRSHQIEMVTSSDSSSHDYASIGCGHGIHHPSISKSSSLSSTTTTSLTDIPSWLTSSSNLRHDDQHQHHRLTTASVETTDDGCGSDAVLCWMQCMDSTSMSCGVGTSIACFDEGSDEVVAGDIMCPTGTDNCELKCVADSLLEPPIDHKGFCYGSGTDMYMDGFTSYINNDDTPQCLNLLFTDWILDNSGKFVAACIGTLLLGIFTEMLGYIRRLIDSFIKSGGFGTYKRAAPLVMSTLYGIQVLMGYFLMLTAMTYQVELFICVIVGLMMGHAAFNLQEPPSANTDPCCVGRVSSDKSHDYKGLHTTLPLTNNLEESIVASPMYQDGDKMLLGVDGMTCSSCTSTVKTALEKMRGVVQVEVNLGNTSIPFGGRASIRTEGDGVSAQSCIATIESVGFDARLI
jgi:copper chaperone CopZ